MEDLGPATDALAAVVAGVRTDQLDAPTPCDDYSVGDLLDHVDGLALAFTAAARKESSVDGPPPAGGADRLAPDWQARIPQRLARLAAAWRDPDAWTGATAAGGIELDGAEAGLVAMNEVVVHGWDLAVATGQDIAPGEAGVVAARQFVDQFSGPGTEEMRVGLFGPEEKSPPDATALEQLVALAGRDPRRWRGSTAHRGSPGQRT